MAEIIRLNKNNQVYNPFKRQNFTEKKKWRDRKRYTKKSGKVKLMTDQKEWEIRINMDRKAHQKKKKNTVL